MIAEALREYLYVRLNIAPPGQTAYASPVRISTLFRHARRFFEFVRAECGTFHIGQVDQALLDQYAKSLGAGRRPEIVSHILAVVFDLYLFRRHLPTISLGFEPWPGRTVAEVAGHRFRGRENRTPRIPENVIQPLLAGALKYVTVFAGDILAARAELIRLEAKRASLVADDAASPRNTRRARRRARLLAFLEDRRRQGRGVPVWAAHIGKPLPSPSPPINWQLIHLHAGLDANDQKSTPRTGETLLGDLVATAIRDTGVEIGGMDTPISTDPDTGQPWRERFDARALAIEERMLQAACYVVCAYLTGMRDSEVQAMRSGCLSISRSEDGIVDRHRVRSIVYKGEKAEGVPAEWITIAPVAEAIRVLERLSALGRGDTDTLWPALNLGRPKGRMLSTAIVANLNEFRDRIDSRCAANDAAAPWRLTTRQFRRTIAWHIANRPFGTIAGMIQYKHASVAAFEGYAGASRSGFRDEVETERRLGQVDDILTYFDERQTGARLSGPAATRVGRALDGAADALPPFPGMIADRGRLRVQLASIARTLHVGALADCFFDPATAVCLRRVNGKDHTTPLISMCEPTRCPNACITARHRPNWERTADEANALLKEKRLSTLQRTALQAEVRRIEQVLAELDEPAHTT
jgi:integrase